MVPGVVDGLGTADVGSNANTAGTGIGFVGVLATRLKPRWLVSPEARCLGDADDFGFGAVLGVGDGLGELTETGTPVCSVCAVATRLECVSTSSVSVSASAAASAAHPSSIRRRRRRRS